MKRRNHCRKQKNYDTSSVLSSIQLQQPDETAERHLGTSRAFSDYSTYPFSP